MKYKKSETVRISPEKVKELEDIIAKIESGEYKTKKLDPNNIHELFKEDPQNIYES